MYEFSVPMAFTQEHIDKIFEINKKVEKSYINTVYFSLPTNSIDYTGFEQDRYVWEFETDFNYWKPLIEQSLHYGANFIYILNSPNVYNYGNEKLESNLEKLDKLIDNLRSLGCNKLRVSNPQLMGYLNKYYSDIELYLSTSMEIKNVKEYTNLFYLFKNIKEFVPSWDLNKNFRFLENIQKKFPNIKVELMVNEGCIPACPFRFIHNNWNSPIIDKRKFKFYYSTKFYISNCSKIRDKNIYYYFCNSNIIYPWEIQEYSKIGINKFKLIGRNSPAFNTGEYIKFYELYLKGIDNIKNIENTLIRYFNHYIEENAEYNFTIKDLKPYLPNINHFKKRGQTCSENCGITCNYCLKCAKNMQKSIEKKEKNNLINCIKPICINSGKMAGV